MKRGTWGQSATWGFAWVLLAGVALPAVADDDVRMPKNPLPPHKVILTEVGGGSDSSASPDGKYLAFSTRRSGNLDVWTCEVETGKLRQITTNPASDNEPRWHPESKYLCFVTMRNNSQDVYIVNLETLEETPIATEDNNEDYPSFRKDGTEVCYTGGPRGYREVMVHNIASGEKRTLTRGYGYVGSTNFSADGKHIVFHTYFDNSYASGTADVFTVSSEKGGKPVNITNDREVWDYKPNWSWDGKWITFSSKRGTPNFNIWLMRPDGSDMRPITNVQGPIPYNSNGEISMSNANVLDQRWSNWVRDGRMGWHQINPQKGVLRSYDVATGDMKDVFTSEFEISAVQASLDGTKLLFENDGRISVMDAEFGAEPKAIGDGIRPRWSADGKSITAISPWGRSVSIVPAEGGDQRWFEADYGTWPAASTSPLGPDGKTIAALRKADSGETLMLIKEDGTEQAVAKDAKSLSPAAWSKDGSHLFFSENVPASVSYMITTEPIAKMEY